MELLSFLKNGLSVYVFSIGIIGCILWYRESNTIWYVFPVFLTLLGFADYLGGYLPQNINSQYYSLLIIPAEFLCYFWLYYKAGKVSKKQVFIGLLLYAISFLTEQFVAYGKNNFSFSSLSYIVGNIVLLSLILYYFYVLSTSDSILQFEQQRMFWVSAGLLVFWLGSLPFYGLINYLYYNHYNVLVSYSMVVLFLNYLMYTIFIGAFIWGKKIS